MSADGCAEGWPSDGKLAAGYVRLQSLDASCTPSVCETGYGSASKGKWGSEKGGSRDGSLCPSMAITLENCGKQATLYPW